MTSAPPSPEERLGTRLEGKYDLVRICGKGGMGVVVEGVHAWTGRRVAVKLLHSAVGSSSEHLEHLLREARTATSLRHPNVVDVLDMGRDGATPFIVMEFLEGESLDALLAREGPLPPERALGLLLPVLGALSMAHDLGIVHRDIKPANIFLSRDAGGNVVPKLLDFGIAQRVSLGTAGARDQVTGTPAYMSPEHARGKNVGPEADVWAMGVLLYRCLSGELPFVGTTPREVVEEVVEGRQRPLTSVRPELPARLAAAIERALSLDPGARYPDMRSFARALLTTASAAGIELPPTPSLIGLTDLGSRGAEGAPPSPRGPIPPAGSGPPESGATDTYRASVPLADSASSMALERTTAPTPRVGRRGALVALAAIAAVAAAVVRLSPGDPTPASSAAPKGPASVMPPAASARPGDGAPEPAAPPVTPPAPSATRAGAEAREEPPGSRSAVDARPGLPRTDPSSRSRMVRIAPPARNPKEPAPPGAAREGRGEAPRPAASSLEPGTPPVPRIRTEW